MALPLPKWMISALMTAACLIMRTAPAANAGALLGLAPDFRLRRAYRMLNTRVARNSFNEGPLSIQRAEASFLLVFRPNFLAACDARDDLHGESVNCCGSLCEDLRDYVGLSV